MKNIMYIVLVFVFIIAVTSIFFIVSKKLTQAHSSDQVKDNNNKGQVGITLTDGKYLLPEPLYESSISIEEALLNRRSTRQYAKGAISPEELSQLLWAAQGITNERGHRTAPSAGATFPLEVYVLASNVEGLPFGFYKYYPAEHAIEKLFSDDVRQKLAAVSYNQQMIVEAPINIVFTGLYERTAQRYGERAIRYVHNEIGHASQNVHLQAVSLKLGTVVIGAFDDDEVNNILKMKNDETVLYMMPVGRLQ